LHGDKKILYFFPIGLINPSRLVREAITIFEATDDYTGIGTICVAANTAYLKLSLSSPSALRHAALMPFKTSYVMDQSVISPSRSKSILTVIKAWLIAGTLDATAATIMFLSSGGKDPVRLFQYIASGVFGQDAFVGGTVMAIWGVVFHYLIALTFTLIFFLIYPQIRPYISRPAIVGLLYGVLVWVIMNRVILPLSNVTQRPFDPLKAIIGMLILMVMIGLPIALIVHKHYSGRS